MGQSHVKITSGMGISTLTSIIKKSLKTHKSGSLPCETHWNSDHWMEVV